MKLKKLVSSFEAVLFSGGEPITLDRLSQVFDLSIEEVTDEETNNAVYDLMGRKVSNPVKGIYIVNDKKVIIK